MNKDLILTIDAGTQSLRALVFDRLGHLIDKAQLPLDAYSSPQEGWMEHNVESFYDAMGSACQQLWQQAVVKPEQVAGVVLTTQRATMINLDKQGNPLRPAIIWADQRRADVRSKRSFVWRVLFKLLGLKNTIDALESACQINWIQQHQPAIWDNTAYYLMLSGYLNYKLTGKIADSVGNQVGFIPFDYKNQDWCAASDWKWACMPVARSQLPQLVPTGDILGHITPQCAADTGILADTPVIAGAADKACEVLGSGCIEPSMASISCGTTATINVTHHRYLEPRPFIPPYPAAIPGVFNLEIQIFRGFWMVSWFKKHLGQHEQQQANKQGKSAEQLFEAHLNNTRPGASGLIMQPYWNPGLGEPGPEARGSLIGFNDAHNQAHIYRALIEGLAYGLKNGKELLEKRGNQTIHTCRIAGGGSQSDGVMQIMADVLNVPCERPSTFEASGLGAAIIGASTLGFYPSIEAASNAMTGTTQRFEPNPEHAALYDRIYREVVSLQYGRLKPLYQKLQAIFG